MIRRSITLVGLAVVCLMPTALLAQQSLNMQFLGTMNKYPTVGPPSFGSYAACWGYVAPDGREYALLGVYTGTSIVDITDAPDLREVAFIPGPPNIIREMKTYGEFAYVNSESQDLAAGAGIQIIDLRNLPLSASLAKTYVWVDTVNGLPVNHPRAHTVSVSGKYLYLNGGSVDGIRILDLSDPVNPVKAGWYQGGYVHDCYIQNDTIYAATIGERGVEIIDARLKAQPSLITRIQYPGSGTHNAWTYAGSSYLVTTDEIGTTQKSLKVWDIRDLNAPSLVGEVNRPGAIVHNTFVKGTLAYTAWYSEGLRVIDLSVPQNPVEVAYYDTHPGGPVDNFVGAWAAFPYYPSGKVIVSDIQTGLYVLRYTGASTAASEPNPNAIPTRIALHQNFPNPFNPTTVIQFDLPSETAVTLKLLNILGEEISVLRDGTLPAGRHTVPIDAQPLASGVYIYRLVTPEFMQSRRLVVTK